LSGKRGRFGGRQEVRRRREVREDDGVRRKGEMGRKFGMLDGVE
jgi:hypothetical protein